MALNSLSPAYLKIRYTANGHPHTQTLPTIIAGTPTPGVLPELIHHGGGSLALADFVSDYGDVWKPFYKTTDSLGVLEVWSQPLPSDDPVFIFAVDMATAGATTFANTPAGEEVVTFRTAHRGGFKLYMMENVDEPNIRDNSPFTGLTAIINLVTYVCGAASPIYGRNGDVPLLGLSRLTKINDVLRRKYLTN